MGPSGKVDAWDEGFADRKAIEGHHTHVVAEGRALSKVMAVTFEAHDFVADQIHTANNVIEMTVDDRPLRLDLSSLAGDEAA